MTSVEVTKQGVHRYKATNDRGGVLSLGDGNDPDFTPVELLLTALAGCGALDLEFITGTRAPITAFVARAEAEAARDHGGNHLERVTVSFDVEFPAGPGGDEARSLIESSIKLSQDQLCTVARTLARETPVFMRTAAQARAEDPSVHELGDN